MCPGEPWGTYPTVLHAWPRSSPCRAAPQHPGWRQPCCPGSARLLPALGGLAGADTAVGAAPCPPAPLPQQGSAGPAARHCSAGCGQPPALATQPGCFRSLRHGAGSHNSPAGYPGATSPRSGSCVALRRWHLCPRGVVLSPAPRLIWGQGPWGRTEAAHSSCQAPWRGGTAATSQLGPQPGQALGSAWKLRASPWGPGAWSCPFGTSPYVARPRGHQLSCHAWRRRCGVARHGTAGSAQLGAEHGAPGGGTRPYRRPHPQAPQGHHRYSPGPQHPPGGPAPAPAPSRRARRCRRGAGWAGWPTGHRVPPAPPSAHPRVWLWKRRAVRAPSPVVPGPGPPRPSPHL